MIIQHNLMAMGANRNYNISDKKMKKATEKLSLGYAITRASDDAAGLTISEKMRSQIRGLNQASKNLGDGISYVQVADGALNEVHAILRRVRELSVKSANDTNEGIDRLAIDAEVQELKKEISKIFIDTEFNSKKIWDENPNNRVQIGTELLPAVSADNTSVSGTLNEINKAAIPGNGRFLLNADDSGITVTWDAYNGNSYTSEAILWTETLAGNHKFSLSDYIDTAASPELVGIDFDYSYTVNEAATLQDVIDSINGEMVYLSPSTYESTTLYAQDGSVLSGLGISFSTSINYGALLASDKNFDVYDDLFIEGSVGGGINPANLINDPTSGASSEKWSFEFQMKNIGTVKATSTSTRYYSYWKDPDQKWWYTNNGNTYTRIFYPTPNDGSLDSVNGSLVNSGIDLVNDSLTGGTIEIKFDLTTAADSPYTLPNGTSNTYVGYTNMYIQVSSTDTIDTIFEKLKKIGGIDIAAGIEATNNPSSSRFYTRGYNTKQILIESPVYRDEMSLSIQSGAKSNEAIQIGYTSLNNHVLGINNVSMVSREKSEEAIEIIDKAQEIVSSQRSKFGAYNNRMEHANSNVLNMAEQTQSSESRIRDANMAKEMVEFSKNKILVQAGQAMITQANQQPEMVLRLLQ